MAKQAKEVGTVDKLPLMPEGMDEEEVLRLALNASEEHSPVPPPQAPPRYAVAVMTLDMSEEEALRVSMEASHVEPPPSMWDHGPCKTRHILHHLQQRTRCLAGRPTGHGIIH
jgi:hypothetical protein